MKIKSTLLLILLSPIFNQIAYSQSLDDLKTKTGNELNRIYHKLIS